LLHLQHNSLQAQKRSLCATRRRAFTAFSCVLFGLLAAVAGCSNGGSNNTHFSFKDPSGEPIRAVARTTVPLAYAASVAMSSVTGSTPPNAVFSYNTCTTIPADCAAVITITDDNFSGPLQLASGTGTITVFGYWSSPTQAIFTVAFSGDAGSGLFPVHNISLIPVLRIGSSLKIVYENIDINAPVKNPGTLTTQEINAVFFKLNTTASNDASSNVNMDAWIIDRNDKNTPDVSDDTYSISGGGQYLEAGVGSGSILQLGMANAVMGSDCMLNPEAGFAVLNELASSTSNLVVATALLSFHSFCDGNAKVAGATGNYLESNGKSIPLNLNNP
jgi:hypothetical protein